MELSLVVLGLLISAILIAGYRLVLRNKNLEIIKELKRIEITYDFQKRFESIYSEYNIGKKSDDEINSYFLKFWNLQIEQFQYYIKDYIDEDAFLYWMRHSIQKINNPLKIENITYKEGWEHASEIIPNKRFVIMVNELILITIDDQANSEIKKIVAKYKKY